MPYSSGGYKPIKRGQALTAREINQNIVQGPMRGAQYTGNADTRRFHNGNAVDLPGDTGISPWSAYMRPAIVVSSGDDTISVKFYSEGQGVGVGSTFTVAKSYKMRISLFPSAATYAANEIITISRVPTVVSGTTYDWVDMAVGKGNGSGIKSADTKANLATIMPDDGMQGYTTGSTKRFYVRIDGDMICTSHLENP